MWCVAQLDEEYIARMEDVLAVYEKPLSELGPVVCIDEKPVVLHQEVRPPVAMRSEEHTSELQSLRHLVCRLLLEKKKNKHKNTTNTRTRIARRPPLSKRDPS